MSRWPTKLEIDNMFTVRRVDLDAFTFPQPKVTVWSNVFDAGGSVDVEASVPQAEKDGDVRLTLASISVEGNRSIVAEREHLQTLIDEWLKDNEGNWRRVIGEALDSLARYYEEREVERSSAAARAARWSR